LPFQTSFLASVVPATAAKLLSFPHLHESDALLVIGSLIRISRVVPWCGARDDLGLCAGLLSLFDTDARLYQANVGSLGLVLNGFIASNAIQPLLDCLNTPG
jgi:hypothetical protein